MKGLNKNSEERSNQTSVRGRTPKSDKKAVKNKRRLPNRRQAHDTSDSTWVKKCLTKRETKKNRRGARKGFGLYPKGNGRKY